MDRTVRESCLSKQMGRRKENPHSCKLVRWTSSTMVQQCKSNNSSLEQYTNTWNSIQTTLLDKVHYYGIDESMAIGIQKLCTKNWRNCRRICYKIDKSTSKIRKCNPLTHEYKNYGFCGRTKS